MLAFYTPENIKKPLAIQYMQGIQQKANIDMKLVSITTGLRSNLAIYIWVIWNLVIIIFTRNRKVAIVLLPQHQKKITNKYKTKKDKKVKNKTKQNKKEQQLINKDYIKWLPTYICLEWPKKYLCDNNARIFNSNKNKIFNQSFKNRQLFLFK